MPESGPPEFPPWLALRLRLDRLGTATSRCSLLRHKADTKGSRRLSSPKPITSAA